MKHSTVSAFEAPEFFDTAKAIRGALGEEQVSASDLSRLFGGAVSYWTRRITGQLPFSDRDLYLIAWATGRHQATFIGGAAPAGWTAPEPPKIQRAIVGAGARSSTDRASDYGSLVRFPHRPVLTLLPGRAS